MDMNQIMDANKIDQNDPMWLRPPSIHMRRLTNDEIVAALRRTSETVHGNVSPWLRDQVCLFEVAAKRMMELLGRYEEARKANARMRRQRNEARAGVVKAEWWNDMDDPDNSYCDPSDALDDAGYGEILTLTGNAQIEIIQGFRLGPAPGADSDDERDFWFETEGEAIAARDAMIAADKAAQAKIDAEKSNAA